MFVLFVRVVQGNTYILKPSEKVPLTMYRTMDLLKRAGVPDGVVNIVNGAVDVVLGICDHKGIDAVVNRR